MRLEEALLSLTSNDQARFTEPQRSQRGYQRKTSEKRLREKENEGFPFCES
jgi:hypothetical protein